MRQHRTNTCLSQWNLTEKTSLGPRSPKRKYMPIGLFETEVGLPCRNPRYTSDGKNGEEFPPVGSHWGQWRQAMSATWNYLATHGDIKNGWALPHLVWYEHPKKYSIDGLLHVVTPQNIVLKNPA
jgi:hypothetical protein